MDAARGDPVDPERPGLTGGDRAIRQTPRQTLNEVLGTDFGKSPSDSTFRLLLAQLDVPGFESLLRDWMAVQPGVTEELDTLVCDRKTRLAPRSRNQSRNRWLPLSQVEQQALAERGAGTAPLLQPWREHDTLRSFRE